MGVNVLYSTLLSLEIKKTKKAYRKKNMQRT